MSNGDVQGHGDLAGALRDIEDLTNGLIRLGREVEQLKNELCIHLDNKRAHRPHNRTPPVYRQEGRE